MLVVVNVGVDRQTGGHAGAEQRQIFGVAADRLGVTGATHMAVQAHHLVGGGHDHVQVVADHQHAGAIVMGQLRDQVVQFRLAGHVHAAHRLVQRQQSRPAQQRARQQHPLQFAARQPRDLTAQDVAGADAVQRRLVLGQGGARRGHGQETAHRQGQGGFHRQRLRHVADGQAGGAAHLAGIGHHQPQRHLDQRGLARPVGADDGDDAARPHRQRHLGQHGVSVARQRHPLQRDQGVIGHGRPFAPGRRGTSRPPRRSGG